MTMADSEQRLRESSALIAELAEQNAQLVARTETLRGRQKRLFSALVLVAAMAAAALWFSLR